MAKDPVELFGPLNRVRVRRPRPIAYVGNALCLFKLPLALLKCRLGLLAGSDVAEEPNTSEISLASVIQRSGIAIEDSAVLEVDLFVANQRK